MCLRGKYFGDPTGRDRSSLQSLLLSLLLLCCDDVSFDTCPFFSTPSELGLEGSQPQAHPFEFRLIDPQLESLVFVANIIAEDVGRFISQVVGTDLPYRSPAAN